MRTLTWIVVASVALWSGYWFIGSRGIEIGLATWIDARRAEGWAADYAAINTAGYPNRFDTTITDLQLADPATGLAWTLPFFQILTLSYTPNHIIAVFPPDQTIATPFERLTLTEKVMRGSMVFVPKTSLEIDRTSFELEDLAFASTQGWTTAVEKGKFATRRSAGIDNAHDIYFQASRLTPSAAMLSFLDPGNFLPDILEGVTLDATVTFDAPWDRYALERARPQPTDIRIKTFDAGWGELNLQAAGSVTIDAGGRADGRIDIRARNWRDMLRVARDTGFVAEEFAPAIESALELLAGLSGNPETIDAPLTFRRGAMYFGGLPVGPAPRFHIR